MNREVVAVKDAVVVEDAEKEMEEEVLDAEGEEEVLDEEEVVDVEAVVMDVEAVVEVVLRLMIDHPSHLKTHLEFKEFSKSFRDVVEEMVAEMVVEEGVMAEEGVEVTEEVEVMEEDVEEEEVKKWQVGERLAVLEEVMQTTVTARVPVAVRLERRSQVVEESMQRNLVIPSALELERRDALQRRT